MSQEEFQISLNVKSFYVIILGKQNLSEYLKLFLLKLVVLFLFCRSSQKNRINQLLYISIPIQWPLQCWHQVFLKLHTILCTQALRSVTARARWGLAVWRAGSGSTGLSLSEPAPHCTAVRTRSLEPGCFAFPRATVWLVPFRGIFLCPPKFVHIHRMQTHANTKPYCKAGRQLPATASQG